MKTGERVAWIAFLAAMLFGFGQMSADVEWLGICAGGIIYLSMFYLALSPWLPDAEKCKNEDNEGEWTAEETVEYMLTHAYDKSIRDKAQKMRRMKQLDAAWREEAQGLANDIRTEFEALQLSGPRSLSWRLRSDQWRNERRAEIAAGYEEAKRGLAAKYAEDIARVETEYWGGER